MNLFSFRLWYELFMNHPIIPVLSRPTFFHFPKMIYRYLAKGCKTQSLVQMGKKFIHMYKFLDGRVIGIWVHWTLRNYMIYKPPIIEIQGFQHQATSKKGTLKDQLLIKIGRTNFKKPILINWEAIRKNV